MLGTEDAYFSYHVSVICLSFTKMTCDFNVKLSNLKLQARVGTNLSSPRVSHKTFFLIIRLQIFLTTSIQLILQLVERISCLLLPLVRKFTICYTLNT